MIFMRTLWISFLLLAIGSKVSGLAVEEVSAALISGHQSKQQLTALSPLKGPSGVATNCSSEDQTSYFTIDFKDAKGNLLTSVDLPFNYETTELYSPLEGSLDVSVFETIIPGQVQDRIKSGNCKPRRYGNYKTYACAGNFLYSGPDYALCTNLFLTTSPEDGSRNFCTPLSLNTTSDKEFQWYLHPQFAYRGPVLLSGSSTIQFKCKCGYILIQREFAQGGPYCSLKQAPLNRIPAGLPPRSKRRWGRTEKDFLQMNSQFPTSSPLECRKYCNEIPECVYALFDHAIQEKWPSWKGTCAIYRGEKTIYDVKEELVSYLERELEFTSVPEGHRYYSFFPTSEDSDDRLFKYFLNPVMDSISKHSAGEFDLDEVKAGLLTLRSYVLLYNEGVNADTHVSYFHAVAERLLNNIYSIRGYPSDRVLIGADGQKLKDELSGGKALLTHFSEQISFLKTQGAISQFQDNWIKFEQNTASAARKSGSFAFKTQVASMQFNQKVGTFLIKEVEKLSSDLEDSMKTASAVATVQQLETVAYAYVKLASVCMASANIFAFGGADAGAIASAMREVQREMTKMFRLAAAIKKMNDAFDLIYKMTTKAIEERKKVEKVTSQTGAFIASFKDDTFSVKLSDAVANEFISAILTYSAPINLGDLFKAREYLNSALDLMCQLIFDGVDMIAAPIYERRCSDMRYKLALMFTYMEKLNDVTHNTLTSSVAVVQKYIALEGAASSSKLLEGIAQKSDNEARQRSVALSTLTTSFVVMRFLYTSQILGLCNLHGYYSGGYQPDMCDVLRKSSKINSVQYIFEALETIFQSIEVPSSEIDSYGSFPMASLSGEQVKNVVPIRLDRLKENGRAVFSFPMNETWLRTHGWVDFADVVRDGGNIFVKSMGVYLPYTDSTKSVRMDIRPTGDYVTQNKDGKRASFFLNADSPAYHFSYKPMVLDDKCASKNIALDAYEPCQDKLLFPKICKRSSGMITQDMMLGYYPPLPSLFSTFEIDMLNDPSVEQLNYPSLATDRKGRYLHNNMQLRMHLVTLQTSERRHASTVHAAPPLTSNCKICPAGSFQRLNTTGREWECVPCPTGTFQPHKGRFACELCPKGTFQASLGKETCQQCPQEQGKCCPTTGLSSFSIDKKMCAAI
eukprot:Nk52_evm10s289 gene=Nk52_evmTU10s289